MKLRALAAFSAAALLGSAATPDAAFANPCRFLEMRMMQIQAGGGGRAARHVQALLVERGCRSGGHVVREAAVPERRARRERASRRSAGPRSAGRTFRTLCVRRCDGYYFPISYSTTKKHFEADAGACARMCPAAEAGLYYHRVGEGAETMVGLDGEPYTAIPSAFRYRLSYDPTCFCGPPGGDRNSAEAAATFGPASDAPAPRPRPAPGEDPETAANRLGGFRPGELETAASGPPKAGAPASVRVVWPNRLAATSDVLLTEVPN
jgi:hypothetical protein